MRKIQNTDTLFMNRIQVLLMRLLFGGYFVYLTLLLLTPNPFRLVPSSSRITHLLELISPWAHSISFALLTVFALLAFRAFATSAIVLGLSAYATLTELLQRLIPFRTTEWHDWFQNLGGIVFGILMMWMFTTIWRVLGKAREETSPEVASSMETIS
jgi:VanZ family protein